MSDIMKDEQLLPGTMRIYDRRADGTLNESAIMLLPQPTDSPDDPLRWSPARKIWHATLVLFVAGFTAATSNDAGSAADSQTTELGISYAQINNAAGVLFIAIGYMTLLLYPIVTLYGRRLQYLICLVLSVGGSVWFALVQTSGDSIGSQVFTGATESCAEALVQTSLSDIFFQHQRGTVLGLYVLATNVGTYMGPLIAGYIADSPLGWRWIGWFTVIISGATLVVFFFGLEETSFHRPRTDEQEPISLALRPEKSREEKSETTVTVNIHVGELETFTASKANKPYSERIRLITPAANLKGWGFKQYFQRLKHIFRVFTFPAVLFAGLQWGAQDAWLTFYLTLEQDNWFGPPWNYSDAADAIMNVPCVIGALIGCLYGGYFSDVFVKWMAKRRGGIAEAEDRLWFMFPAGLISPAGLILFGIGTNNGWPWPVPYVGLAFIGFGWGCAGDLSMAYLMDAYPDMVLEGMVAVAVINNTMGMIFTFAASSWLADQSVTAVMCEIGALSCIFITTAAPMMYWGKSFRRWTLPKYMEFIAVRDRV